MRGAPAGIPKFRNMINIFSHGASSALAHCLLEPFEFEKTKPCCEFAGEDPRCKTRTTWPISQRSSKTASCSNLAAPLACSNFKGTVRPHRTVTTTEKLARLKPHVRLMRLQFVSKFATTNRHPSRTIRTHTCHHSLSPNKWRQYFPGFAYQYPNRSLLKSIAQIMIAVGCRRQHWSPPCVFLMNSECQRAYILYISNTRGMDGPPVLPIRLPTPCAAVLHLGSRLDTKVMSLSS